MTNYMHRLYFLDFDFLVDFLNDFLVDFLNDFLGFDFLNDFLVDLLRLNLPWVKNPGKTCG